MSDIVGLVSTTLATGTGTGAGIGAGTDSPAAAICFFMIICSRTSSKVLFRPPAGSDGASFFTDTSVSFFAFFCTHGLSSSLALSDDEELSTSKSSISTFVSFFFASLPASSPFFLELATSPANSSLLRVDPESADLAFSSSRRFRSSRVSFFLPPLPLPPFLLLLAQTEQNQSPTGTLVSFGRSRAHVRWHSLGHPSQRRMGMAAAGSSSWPHSQHVESWYEASSLSESFGLSSGDGEGFGSGLDLVFFFLGLVADEAAFLGREPFFPLGVLLSAPPAFFFSDAAVAVLPPLAFLPVFFPPATFLAGPGFFFDAVSFLLSLSFFASAALVSS
mmetsp:Transcript_7371/g.20451  ORF Transcript_7371/g.20451 Transcript_7371/m.20451 type:complete len:333 (+) Transcript_7371:1150-2148(+)